MDRDALAARIDHTVLGPETTPTDVERVVDEAVAHGMNACVPPCYVTEAFARAAGPAADDAAPALTIATVVGFPHGQHAPEAKLAEAELAWADGADELDVVANVGRLGAGERDAVRAELASIVDATPAPVKVIVEAGLLDDRELHAIGAIAADAGAASLKTSTGFAGGAARVADVELLSEYLPVKASGGIGDWATAAAMLDAGAERIGASSGVAILDSFDARTSEEAAGDDG